MLGSHAIKSIAHHKNEEHPLLTLSIGSQPNYLHTRKSDVNTAFYSTYINHNYGGHFDLHGTIDHRVRVTSDTLIYSNQGSRCHTYRQVGSLNMKTGIPLIKRLYEALVVKHSHLSLKPTWLVGVFVLVRAYNSLKGGYYFNAILGVVPDVPNGTGQPAIATLGWNIVSDELNNYLRMCETNTLNK